MRALPLNPADALRLALLAALGLPAFAGCGGTAIESMDDDSSSTGGTHATGGSTASGGQIGSGGTTSTGGTLGTGGNLGTGGAVRVSCTDPQPLMPGYDTGFYTCAEGYEHRAEKKDCPSFLPRLEAQQPAWSTDECSYDTDCPGPYGYCTLLPAWGDQTDASHICATGCVSDSDCNTGYICRCGDPIGQCVPSAAKLIGSGCGTDSDCGSGLLCVFVPQIGCGAGVTYTCQTADDECRTQADCPHDYDDCALAHDGTSRRVCQSAPVCGRPFLVDFLERRASSAERVDWTLSARSPSLGSLGEGERGRLAAHWTDIALMEHASIAAFARFSLQLLSLGAPADLIEETNRALADETKHARLCFALASAYHGAPVGPGALEVSGSLDGSTPEAILRTVIREGCLGETQAALEAAEAAALCKDPAVAEVLTVITADEGRHAELAYRFVQWLLREKPELESVAREEFSAALAAVSSEPLPRSEEPSLSRFGVLDATSREHIRRRALTSVLAPCAEGLLAPDSVLPHAPSRVSRSVSFEALS